MFDFYLNGNKVTDPINWNNFTEIIERDDVVKGLLPKYEAKLTFTGNGYKYIYEQYILNGFCNIIELKVNQSCSGNTMEEVFVGNIFISDCRFNLNKYEVECSIEDNSFGARIRNNKSIKTAITGNLSKNGMSISPAQPTIVTLFNPATGSNISNTRKVFSWYESLKYLVAFMTDDLVGFESDFLASVPEYTFVSGLELRTFNNVSPFLSFDGAYSEISKKYPIGFTIIHDGTKPVIKIEKREDLFKSPNSLVIPNIQDLIQYFNNELLYSNFKIGGPVASYDPLIHTLVPRQFIGFQNEEYFLTGICNIDKTLDLTSTYILDSNIIQEITMNNINKEWDNDVFILEINLTGPGVGLATKYTQVGASGYFYNGNFTNEKIANRNEFSGDAALYSGLDTSGFRAEITNRPYSVFGNIGFRDFQQADTPVGPSPPQPPPQISPDIQAKFNDDFTSPNYNLGLNYSATTTWAYTAPLAGSYYFYTEIVLKIFQPANFLTLGINRKWRVRLKLKQYDASNLVVASFTETFPSDTAYFGTGVGAYHFINSKYINCQIGDYVKVFVSLESEPINRNFASEIRALIDNSSIFKSLATTSGGGVVQAGSQNAYKASLFEFKNPLSNSEYKLLKQDLSKSVLLNHDGKSNKKGWLQKTSRNISTGEMDWLVVSDLNNS